MSNVGISKASDKLGGVVGRRASLKNKNKAGAGLREQASRASRATPPCGFLPVGLVVLIKGPIRIVENSIGPLSLEWMYGLAKRGMGLQPTVL